MMMVDSSVPTILDHKNEKQQQQQQYVRRQLEDGGNILRINFDVMITFKSILTDHNVERYVLGAFNTYQDQDNYRTALQDTGNPSFQDITTITASLPTSSIDNSGNGENGVDGALGENDTSPDNNGRLGGITRIQGKTAIVGGILIGICVLALMGVLYVVKTKYYTQRQRRHQRLDHPYFGSDYTPRTPNTPPPSPPTDENDRRRRRGRESSTTSSLFTSLPMWNMFRKKKQHQQQQQQQQESPYDGTWNAAIHQNHFSSVEINIEAHGEQSDVSTLHDPIPPGEDQLSLEEDNTVVFSYDYKKAHGIGVIGTEDSSSEGFSPRKSSSEHQRPLILGGIPTITLDPDTSSAHNDDGGGGGSGATSPLMATAIPASSSSTKSDTSTTLDDPYSITEDQIEINAPSGKLGLILETAPNNGVPTVTKIKNGSPLEYQVKVDDKLLSVDGFDVTVMKGREVSKLIASKQDNYVVCVV